MLHLVFHYCIADVLSPRPGFDLRVSRLSRQAAGKLLTTDGEHPTFGRLLADLGFKVGV